MQLKIFFGFHNKTSASNSKSALESTLFRHSAPSLQDLLPQSLKLKAVSSSMSFNPFAAILFKNDQQKCKFETLKPFFFFFALAGERIFIKTHSIESRCVT